MACRKGYTPNLKERVLEALHVNKRMSRLWGIPRGMTIEEISELIYGLNGPEWKTSCIRVTVNKLRREGVLLSNKVDRLHFGKTGRGTAALYNLREAMNYA